LILAADLLNPRRIFSLVCVLPTVGPAIFVYPQVDCPALVNVSDEWGIMISAKLKDAILALPKQLCFSAAGQIGGENKGADAVSQQLILHAFLSALIRINCDEYSGSYVRDYALILNARICRHIFAVDAIFRALRIEDVLYLLAVEAFVEIESPVRRPFPRFPTRSPL
jgi:hypothetical protein